MFQRINGNGTAPFLSAAAGIAAGIMMTASPSRMLRLAAVLIGCVLVAAGICSLLKAAKENRNEGWMKYAPGTVLIAAGFAAYSMLRFVIGIVPVVLGIALIIFGVWKIMWSNRIGRGIAPGAVTAVLSVLLGLFMLFHPFASGNAMIRMIGIAVLLESAQDLGVLLYYGGKC